MTHVCDICRCEFKGWNSDVPFISGLFDSMVVTWRDNRSVTIEDYKMCPGCREKIQRAIEEIRTERGYYD